jgi:hypothetical protein
MIKNDNEKNSKKLIKYECIKCDFLSCNKNDYRRHLQTDKHMKITDDNEKTQITQKNSKKYECSCGKIYKYASGLSIHKKKCNNVIIVKSEIKNEKENNNNDTVDFKSMFIEMLNQNKELQKTIIEQNKTIQEIVPKIGNNNVNIVNSNNTNNLTLLNDKCKDALSMNDFINSIQVDVKHLSYTAENGLPNGISNLFLEHYNSLPILKRPLWCADKKRKKLYIKDSEWHEDKNQEKTKKAIEDLSKIQAKNVKKYSQENPDWMHNDKKKDDYISIVKQTTEDLDDNKKVNVINNILENIHLSDECRENLQKIASSKLDN